MIKHRQKCQFSKFKLSTKIIYLLYYIYVNYYMCCLLSNKSKTENLFTNLEEYVEVCLYAQVREST
jgi:hypothetical protein